MVRPLKKKKLCVSSLSKKNCLKSLLGCTECFSGKSGLEPNTMHINISNQKISFEILTRSIQVFNHLVHLNHLKKFKIIKPFWGQNANTYIKPNIARDIGQIKNVCLIKINCTNNFDGFAPWLEQLHGFITECFQLLPNTLFCT